MKTSPADTNPCSHRLDIYLCLLDIAPHPLYTVESVLGPLNKGREVPAYSTVRKDRHGQHYFSHINRRLLRACAHPSGVAYQAERQDTIVPHRGVESGILVSS